MDAFEKKSCCLNQASAIQILTTNYYMAIDSYIDGLMGLIYQAELFGKPTEQLYDKMNNFHYLYGLLLMIYDEMLLDARNNSISTGCYSHKGQEYYMEKYNINCIVKSFFCNGYDIKDALNVIGLDSEENGEDGIGFMSIGYSQSVRCTDSNKPFIVR